MCEDTRRGAGLHAERSRHHPVSPRPTRGLPQDPGAARRKCRQDGRGAETPLPSVRLDRSSPPPAGGPAQPETLRGEGALSLASHEAPRHAFGRRPRPLLSAQTRRAASRNVWRPPSSSPRSPPPTPATIRRAGAQPLVGRREQELAGTKTNGPRALALEYQGGDAYDLARQPSPLGRWPSRNRARSCRAHARGSERDGRTFTL